MRVRPATPLSIILLAAFALLLLSVLSTPIIPGIHLAAYNDVTFGVFGFCTSGQCSGYAIGYNTASGELSNADFSLQSNARNSLTHLLIVHPIAALFTLILLILSVLSHLNGPAHSPRYLLAILILSLPTFVLSLLAFLVDILIFLPHVQWGGWVVLGATVLNAIAGIITCGMRRTLVQKVARRKRIAEAPPTNGTEFYANQPQVAAVPPIPESNMGDKMPEFATFEVDKPVHGEPEGEHIPLNPRSRAMPPSAPEERVMGGASSFNQPSLRRAPSDRSEGYGPPPRGAGPLSRPNPPGQVRGQYPNQPIQSANNGNPGPYGAPPPRGYGSPAPGYNGDGYNGRPPQGGYRGPPPQNGPGVFNPGTGLGPPPRRGPGPNQFGSRGPPPQNGGPYGGGGQYGMGPGMGMAHHRRPIEQQPPPQHQPQRESREYDFPAEQPHVDERREFEQTLPAAAGGTAVGIAAPAPAQAQATNERYRDDDRRVQPAELAADMQREPTPPRLAVVNDTRQLYDNEYVPPRSVWNGQSSGTPPAQSRTPPPAELPTDADASPARRGNNAAPRPSESYYEDVAPVFDATHVAHSQSPHPHAPMPGGMPGPVPYRIHIPQQQQQQQQMPLRTLEDLQDGQRSPAMSTTSNFTSISQRPPNPNWVPGPGQPPMPGGMNQGRRGPTSSQLLGGNPDFELPTGRGGRFRGGAGMGR